MLAANPTQTWSFYIECPVIRDHQSILDPNWRFTTAPAMRTIISCIDEHNFILLTVTPALSLWSRLLLGVAPLALMGVSVFVLVERIREVRSGEEDDLDRY